MNKKTLSKTLLTALLLAATGLSTMGSAQEGSSTRPTAEQIANMNALNNAAPRQGVPLPCCKCVGQSTSANLSTGTANWTVTGPSTVGITVNAVNEAWTTMLAPAAQWISPLNNPTAVGVYTYETKIDLRSCVIPSAVMIEGKFLADNHAVLLVDGREIKSSQGTPNYGFLPGSLTPFSTTLPAGSTGVHTITVRARNEGGPTGIVVVANATRKCGDNPEVQPPRG
jgi:hypothetical protein